MNNLILFTIFLFDAFRMWNLEIQKVLRQLQFLNLLQQRLLLQQRQPQLLQQQPQLLQNQDQFVVSVFISWKD